MNVEVPQIQFIDRMVDSSSVLQRRVPTVQTVQKTDEIPQLQSLGKVDAGNCVGGVGFVRHPTFTRSAPTTSCVCHPSVAWDEYGFGRPSFEWKYCGTCVFTVPVAEPSVLSFTVPLIGCTIVATASVVTTCASSAGRTDSAAPLCCGGVCVAMSCGGGSFSPDGAYDSVWDSVWSITGKYTILFPVPRGRWECLHAE